MERAVIWLAEHPEAVEAVDAAAAAGDGGAALATAGGDATSAFIARSDEELETAAAEELAAEAQVHF